MKVQLSRISKSFPDKDIFEALSFEFSAGKKTALLGLNGSGKTTLLRMITGEVHPDSGDIFFQGGRIGLVEQEFSSPPEWTVKEVCGEVFAPVVAEQHRLEALERCFEALSAFEQHQYAEQREKFIQEGGYDWPRRVETVLTGIGFHETDFNRAIGSLSGGEKRRVLLARALLVGQALLLLDEPTNHLDLETIDWLAKWLVQQSCTVIFVSHDRHFIDAVADEIVEIDSGKLFRYGPGYENFRNERARRIEEQQKQYERQQEFIRRNEEFIRKNIAGQKTKQAQSRRKMLEKIDRLEPPVTGKSIRTVLEKSGRESHVVAEAVGVSVVYGTRRILDNVSFTAYRGEKIALVGRNGCGKTTLIRLLAGEAAEYDGRLRIGSGLEVAYFPQEGELLDPEDTLIEAVRKFDPGITNEEVRTLLGGFLFSGQTADKKIKQLSGGEKSRIILAGIIRTKPNVLILDEPTNHLDLQSRILLETLLDDFEGTVFLVSHDRRFVDEVATVIYHIQEGQLHRYEGNLSGNRERIWPVEAVPEKKESVREPVKASVDGVEQQKQHRRGANRYKIEPLENRIAALEAESTRLQEQMLGEDALKDGRIYAELAAECQKIEDELEELYAQWEELLG